MHRFIRPPYRCPELSCRRHDLPSTRAPPASVGVHRAAVALKTPRHRTTASACCRPARSADQSSRTDRRRLRRCRGRDRIRVSSSLIRAASLDYRASISPSGAFPFFALLRTSSRNQHVTLETPGGRNELRVRLLAAEEAEARFCCWSGALLSLRQRPDSRHAAVGHALAAFRRGRRIADVVDETA